MIITEISTVVLRLPVVLAIGDGTQDVLIVVVHTDEGVTGVGEVHTSPTVAEAVIHAPVSHVRSRGLASVLVGQDPLDTVACWERMYEATEVYGRRGVVMHAISGVDLALWDLRGKVEGRSVAELLGGRQHRQLAAYASVLMPDTVDEARQLARDCAAQGFAAVKYGWGGLGAGIEQAVRLVAAVREEAGDGEVMIDIGAGLDVEQALRLAEAFEPYDLTFLEEPLHPDDLAGFRRLAEASPIPIATGEKETSLAGFTTLIEQGRPDIVQPDLARAGGFTEVERIWHRARDHDVRVIPHCWSTDVLVAATMQFLASRPEPVMLEFCLEDNPIRREVAVESLWAVDGYVTVDDRPGLGITLNPRTLRELGVSFSGPAQDVIAAATR